MVCVCSVPAGCRLNRPACRLDRSGETCRLGCSSFLPGAAGAAAASAVLASLRRQSASRQAALPSSDRPAGTDYKNNIITIELLCLCPAGPCHGCSGLNSRGHIHKNQQTDLRKNNEFFLQYPWFVQPYCTKNRTMNLHWRFHLLHLYNLQQEFSICC